MNKINIKPFLLIGLLGLIWGCQKMEDIHAEFLEDGEIIYAPKPFAPRSYAGRNRLMLEYVLYNAPTVKQCIVEWDEGNSSKTIDLIPKLPSDTISILLDNLEEKSYLFDVYTIDEDGNRSIKEQVTGSAYADRYQASLNSRLLSGMDGGGTIDSVVISWGLAAEGLTGVEISYLDGDENTITKWVPAGEDRTVIRGWKPFSTLTYHSHYIPEPGAIDTFTVEAQEMLPDLIIFEGQMLDKTGWEIVDFSTEEPGEGAPNGLASAAIDGDLNTFWHTQWNGGSPGYPHFITIDMKQVAVLNKLTTYRRQGDGRGQTSFQILTSLDGENFEDQGTFDYDNQINSQTYPLNLPAARYIKYVALSGPNFFAFLAELDVEGQYLPANKLDKTAWSVVDFSSEENAEAQWSSYDYQGKVEAAIDDILETFWHSQWDAAQPNYPHSFTIDLGEVHKLGSIECFRRQGNGNGQTKFKILTSIDNVEWVDQGEHSFDAQSNEGQTYIFKFLPEARYVQYIATEGPNHYAFLAELSLYGE